MIHVLASAGAKLHTITCLAVFLVLPSASRADTITLIASRDTTIFRDLPSNSDGAGAALFVGNITNSSPRRALLDFNIADNIPAGSTITGVQLRLVLEQTGPAETRARPIELHRLLADWGEGTTGRGTPANRSGRGFATPADGTSATWSHRFYNTMPWTNAGGDFAAAASGSTLVGTARGTFVWDSTPDMVNDVQSWLQDPSSNFGWILLDNESTASTARRFDSREAATSTLRPALEITYSGSPVPEPSTLTVLALGMLGLVGSVWRQREWARHRVSCGMGEQASARAAVAQLLAAMEMN
jgi:hypothetical protein